MDEKLMVHFPKLKCCDLIRMYKRYAECAIFYFELRCEKCGETHYMTFPETVFEKPEDTISIRRCLKCGHVHNEDILRKAERIPI